MFESEKNDFARLMAGVFQTYDKSVNPAMLKVWWAALDGFSLADVDAALMAHVRDPKRGQFFPKPADIIAQMVGETSGWPDASLAWAAINVDDSKTIVWCDEMAEAAGVARPLIEMGDKFGARAAFVAAYEAAIERAKASGKKPRAWVSLGSDKSHRQIAVDSAVKVGFLSSDEAARALPSPERLGNHREGYGNAGGLGGAIAGLLENAEQAAETPEDRAKVQGHIAKLREVISSAKPPFPPAKEQTDEDKAHLAMILEKSGESANRGAAQ